jgi:hydroxyacylglutathione hydrolase
MIIFEDLYGFLWINPTANNCNAYFINGEKRILVDPGHIVLVTHGHPDHMEGIKRFLGTSTLIAFPRMEMDFIRAVAPNYGEAHGLSGFDPDVLLQEGDMKMGDLTFQVIHTPGHTPGSICFYWPEMRVLFTGDVIFDQGVGRTDLPGGKGEDLKMSIRKLSQFQVDHLLPGHGNVISGRNLVRANFSEIERVWFAYL